MPKKFKKPQQFKKHKEWTTSLIKQMFMDEADLDYIAGRQCHLIGCFNQFLWLASQSTEKYLKSMLLYNGYTAKFGHEYLKCAADFICKNLSGVSISKDVLCYIETLDLFGSNRYGIRSRFTNSTYLTLFDKTVSELRPFCVDLSSQGPQKRRSKSFILEKVLSGHDIKRKILLSGNQFLSDSYPKPSKWTKQEINYKKSIFHREFSKGFSGSFIDWLFNNSGPIFFGEQEKRWILEQRNGKE